MIYGGTIRPGYADGQKLDVVSAFQSYGEYLSGRINEEERLTIVRHSCPGAGACGGMYTANTMASAIEALGMTLAYSSSLPAEDPLKLDECFRAGAAIKNLLERDLKPRSIMTREAFENAMAIVCALGGSTNAVLHLIAIARSADVTLTIDDLQAVSDRTPLLADFRPSGPYVMEDLHKVGGIPAVIKMLLEAGLVNGDCVTVTGKTVRENVKDLPGLTPGQQIVRPVDNPLKTSGHIQILRGNLAPDGAVAKITGKEGLRFSGPARVFDSEEEMLHALEKKLLEKGDVIVIRYEGPKGGPGMPEMLTPTSAIVGAGLGKDVALITDGRFSGGSHGFLVGHITPEAQEGGPIAIVQDGDIITIDVENHSLNVDLTDEKFTVRRERWHMPPYKAKRGTLAKYIRLVKNASFGCVTDE
jgi:dihydroxy-acid dehydratase